MYLPNISLAFKKKNKIYGGYFSYAKQFLTINIQTLVIDLNFAMEVYIYGLVHVNLYVIFFF